MKKRRWFLLALAGVFLLALFALLGGHWRLYGWLRGEPFCEGYPASYYASRIRAAWIVRSDLGGAVRPRSISRIETLLRRYRADAVVDALWPDYVDSNDSHQPFGPDTPDAEMLPVLLVLLDDSDIRVRWWASQKLARMRGEAASTAASALERLLRDEDPSNRFIAVTAIYYLGPSARPALPTLFALRGDTTRVDWMGMQMDELVNRAIENIARGEE